MGSGSAVVPPAPFDLPGYLERIGFEGTADATPATLRSLHRAHASAVPFENLDIQLGRPIRLDAASVQAKLVRDRRGGYCFEQNHLLMWGLEAVGFEVTPLAAWVRIGSESASDLRTHMALKVEVDGSPWLADVGFGADGLSEPILFADGALAEQDGRRYRLVTEPDGIWALQRSYAEPAEWFDLYAFTMDPATPGDFAHGNRYTSTDPGSPFVRSVTAQRSGGLVRPVLRNRHLVEAMPDGERHVARLHRDEELLEVLADRFSLSFPPGTRFRALTGDSTEHA
jgi:N-hydroxyarylamine O-acetyltransferase